MNLKPKTLNIWLALWTMSLLFAPFQVFADSTPTKLTSTLLGESQTPENIISPTGRNILQPTSTLLLQSQVPGSIISSTDESTPNTILCILFPWLCLTELKIG